MQDDNQSEVAYVQTDEDMQPSDCSEVTDQFENVLGECEADEVEGKYTSSSQMLFLLLRANVGAGCLSLPWAFGKGGTLMSPILGTMVGLIVYYNVLVLIRSSETLEARGVKFDTYAALAHAAWGTPGEVTVKFCIVLLQLGICVVAFSFAAESLSAVLPMIDNRLLLTIILIPILGLSMIQNLSQLSPFAVAGTCCLFLSVLVVIGFGTSHLATRPSHNLPLVAWSTLPIYFGSIVYAWECIGVVMAFRKSMGPNHKEFLPTFNVMMFVSGVTFLALGEIAYLAYGAISSPSVLVFLADNVRGPMFPMINLLLAFATILGFPLQLNPAVGIFREKLKLSENDAWKMAYLRLGLVGLCYILAMLVPQFALVVSLVGTSVGSTCTNTNTDLIVFTNV